MHTTQKTTYTPYGGEESGLAAWKPLLSNLFKCRNMIFYLARRNIVVKYRQSVMGYVWTIMLPLLTVTVAGFLASRRVLTVGDTGMPYILFALCNLSVWMLFAGILSAATGSLRGVESVVTRINFPRDAIVIASLGQPLVDFLVRLLLVVILYIWLDALSAWRILYVLLLILPLILMALGIGFFLAILNMLVHDVSYVLGIFLTFGVFLAPILYPPPVTWPYFLVNVLNPVSPYLIAMQDLLVCGCISQPRLLVAGLIFSVLVFLIGWRIFHLAISRVTERA